MEKEAQNDLREDLEELIYLFSCYSNHLRSFQKLFSRIADHSSIEYIKNQTEYYLAYLQIRTTQLKELVTKSQSNLDVADIFSISKQRAVFFDQLRTVIASIGALLTSTDWQSPSYTHSLQSQAGIQEGEITATINDYKRDRHLNEIQYQDAFIKEYIDGVIKFPMSAYLTTSGMAALTAIITYLHTAKNIVGPVMIGKSIYFENAEMIRGFFKEKNIVEVDEMDTESILQTFNTHQPDLLIFDSLCNATTVAAPDLTRILKHITTHAQKETYFIIDNSTLSISLQPLKEISIKSNIRLIVFESLNKYHQFGLDRVTAGIIWMRGISFANFNYARVHSGTNIVDSSCYALPLPNRKQLEKRLKRFNRNATYLAAAISDHLKTSSSKKIESVVYPGLESHPSFAWIKDSFFKGSYFVIDFKIKYKKVSEYQRFVKAVLDIAKKEKVSIVGGTSFGLNTTRIYLTAKNSKFGPPFVRVSVGTENRLELEKIKNVFIKTIKSF
ncbi:MAG: PLP-dependent transferase [Patescibacteria group bacterium]